MALNMTILPTLYSLTGGAEIKKKLLLAKDLLRNILEQLRCFRKPSSDSKASFGLVVEIRKRMKKDSNCNLGLSFLNYFFCIF